jgi:glycosyltransferase involved in cell wall biosynthesis
MHSEPEPLLQVEIEGGLPDELVVGAGNALFVHGWCFHGERRLHGLAMGYDGHEVPVIAHSMPRSDVLRGRDPFADPHGHAYRSGFWAIVPIERVSGPRELELELIASLEGGERCVRRLAPVNLQPAPPPAAAAPPLPEPTEAAAGEPLVAICMTTYNPRLDLFRAQVESLRAQTHRNWVCLVSDDQSLPDVYESIEAELAGDPRFQLSRSERRLGYYRNFERVLGLAPAEAELIALCDQDDRWYPEKIGSLRAALEPGVTLAYSDMRIVGDRGGVISDTYWTERRNNHTDMASLMVANTVTAAASIFPRELLDRALPFPARVGHAFHDHWLALVALASGRIAYVDRPLYDYVQHAENAFGRRGASWGERRLALRPPTRTTLSLKLLRWRADYFETVVPAQLHAVILGLRCGDRLRGRRRRAVRMFRSSQRGLGSAATMIRMALRALGARERRSPTMGRERLIARGLLWRLLVPLNATLRRRRREHHAQGRAVPAPPPIDPGAAEPPATVGWLKAKLAPLSLEVDETLEPRVNMLIPTVDLDHFFGAYIGKFNLARRLSQAGMRVRLVAVDPTHLPGDWRRRVEGYDGLGSLFDHVEVEYAPTREQLRLRVSPADTFVATTSWTAHLAHRASAQLGRRRFLFVIQEYDPLTYPVGTIGAVTRQAYAYPHFAVFSTELLRQFFRRRGIGVYAGDPEDGDRDSVSFENAITRVDAPSADDLRRQDRRLLFYARPEAHAERNMYELGLIALGEAIDRGCFDRRWHFFGIGAREDSLVEFANGRPLRILERQDQEAYRELLARHSIGLSLQDTPHPSLVPLEMASAGMLVVTSTFENKTAESLRAISQNLIPVEPTVDGVTAGLFEAVATVDEFERRARQARDLHWSRSWEESLDDELIARIKDFVDRAA